MKTLHLTHTNINTDSRILKEISALKKSGYEVNGIGVLLSDDAVNTKIENDVSINTLNLISKKLKFLPRVIRHCLTLTELIVRMTPLAVRIRPDIVHCHDTTVLPIGFIVKIICGSKLIYDAHELESDRNGIGYIESKFTLFVEKILWRYIDVLIVVSPSIEEWYNKNIGIKRSIVVLNSPKFDDSSNFKNATYLRQVFQIPEQSLIFIYIGLLVPGRGIELILDVFKSKHIKSHIVFLGFGDMAVKIDNLSKIFNNIHLHSPVEHSQVVPIASSANYGICMIENVSKSDYYCLPNKLFEYCFAKIPVLASNFPDIRNVILEHDVGVCCELDINSIEATIAEIEMCSREYSFKNIETLSWECQADKVVAIYTELMNSINHLTSEGK